MKFHVSKHQTQIFRRKLIVFRIFWPNINIFLQLEETECQKSRLAVSLAYQDSEKSGPMESSPVRLDTAVHCGSRIVGFPYGPEDILRDRLGRGWGGLELRTASLFFSGHPPHWPRMPDGHARILVTLVRKDATARGVLSKRITTLRTEFGLPRSGFERGSIEPSMTAIWTFRNA